MLTPSQPATPANAIKDTTTKTFAADVIEESRAQPVLVDFWAPWCGPCKQLTPVLEKVIAAAQGKVKLVKMNIDEHPAIPGQMGIKSIPAVIAFKDGRPVDGFMGALPESQIKQFIEQVTGTTIGPSEIEHTLEAGDALLADGEAAAAVEAFTEALAIDDKNVRALAGLAQAYLLVGDVDKAKGMLATIPEPDLDKPPVAAVRSAIDLAEKTASLGDLGPLFARIEANPLDHQARFDLALGLAAAGRREEAVDHLIDLVRRDKEWNEEAARKQLVQFFAAWGFDADATLYGRRRLSAILFS